MSKNTEWLSVTENLIYCTGQKTHYNDYKLLLDTVQVQEQVTPKSENRKSSPCSTSWRHLHNKYTTVP